MFSHIEGLALQCSEGRAIDGRTEESTAKESWKGQGGAGKLGLPGKRRSAAAIRVFEGIFPAPPGIEGGYPRGEDGLISIKCLTFAPWVDNGAESATYCARCHRFSWFFQQKVHNFRAPLRPGRGEGLGRGGWSLPSVGRRPPHPTSGTTWRYSKKVTV